MICVNFPFKLLFFHKVHNLRPCILSLSFAGLLRKYLSYCFCLVDVPDQLPCLNLSVTDKPIDLAFKVESVVEEYALNTDFLIPDKSKNILTQAAVIDF